MSETIIIEIVKGGFVLQYPGELIADSDYREPVREVFVTQRKLNNRLKEVIGSLSLVGEN